MIASLETSMKGGHMFNRILVCLDGSALAEEILPYATEVARRFGSKVVLLEVTTPPSIVIEPTTGYSHTTSLAEVQRSEEEAASYLEDISHQLKEQALDVEYLTIPGSPGKTIISYAEENNIGLIALGTHGRGGLVWMAFGSVTDYVLRHSNLPLLVMRPQQSE
jgi:nucleotide-binding universal stress UspA family protein